MRVQMKHNAELDKWCREQERFLREHIHCLQQGRIRVHAVEDNRFIDTTDDVTEDFRRRLADLMHCMGSRH
jgi:hypothetical protein